MSLETCLIQFVEAPTQRLCSQVLLVRGLAVIEDVEQSVCIDPSGCTSEGRRRWVESPAGSVMECCSEFEACNGAYGRFLPDAFILSNHLH